MNAALLSRARVFRLEPHSDDDLVFLLARALQDSERGLGMMQLGAARRGTGVDCARGAQGDARRALDVLELAAKHTQGKGAAELTEEGVAEALAGRTLLYDKSGEEHYNVVSAFIKSMRGSDPGRGHLLDDAHARGRRRPAVRVAPHDHLRQRRRGHRGPVRASASRSRPTRPLQRLGMPEGMFAMAQCCHHLACAPKSNASYKSWTKAREDVQKHGALPVPLKLRNAATKAMKEWGYGAGY